MVFVRPDPIRTINVDDKKTVGSNRNIGLRMPLPPCFNMVDLTCCVFKPPRSEWHFGSWGTWEHPITMILAVAVAHITWTRVKKSSTDAGKFRTGTVGYAVAGLLVALGVMRITGGF